MKKKNVKICVVGGGKIGSEIAAQLTDNGCEVTVIDTNLDLINKISNAMDVICLRYCRMQVLQRLIYLLLSQVQMNLIY